MRVTSVDSFFMNPAFHRKPDSDNDSAISMSPDLAGIEKQRSMSMVEAYGQRHSWSWKSIIFEPILFLLPSFVSRRLRGLPNRPERQTGIAALDGLRGIACLIVLNERLTANYSHKFLLSSSMNELESIPVQWPMIRVLWSGFTMVNILFIISGYVLSYKPIRQMHRGNTSDAQRYLTSSTVRRGIRLYIPTLVALFGTAILSYLGVFDHARSTFDNEKHAFDLSEASPPRFVSITEQMKDVGRHVLTLFDLLHRPDDQLHAGDYDLYSWAIAVQFRNSMILLLALFAVSRFRTKFRLITSLTLVAFAVLLTGNRSVALFLSGMILADIDQLRCTHTRHFSYSTYYHEKTSSTRLLAIFSPRSPIYPIIFLGGMLICSIPAIGAEYDTLYKHIHNLVPQQFLSLSHGTTTEWIRVPGSVMIVWSSANSTVLQPLFTNRVAQYLGQISFALFLMHGNILKLILHTHIPIFYERLGGDGTKSGQSMLQFVVAWWFGMVMCLALSVWCADVFWRAVDLPTVRFAKWLERRVSMADDFECSSPRRNE